MNIMKNHLLPFGLLMLTVLNGYASDLENGRDLHQHNCIRCHNASVYSSENRKVMSKKALIERVKLCDYSLGTQLFDDDIADIAAYLNKEYYHFD